MVEAIGLAIIGALTAAPVAASIAGITILGVGLPTIIGTAVILGGSLLVSALTTPDTRQKVQAQQFSTRQSLPPRRRAYGRTKLSGPKVEWKAYQGFFINALYHVEGPIGGYDEIWFDDKKANLPVGTLGGYAGVAPWFQYVSLDTHVGTDDQATSPILRRLPWWSATDTLAGCAYTAALHVAPEERFFKKIYTSGTYPEHRVVIRGSLVRNINDPAQTSASSTWQWSDNPTLCIRDHITHVRWGMKVPETLIDDASFSAKANSDAAAITRKDGTTAARYYLGGAFDLTEQPADVLQGMLDACDGRLFLTTDGKIGISGGTYIPPEVTLRDPQIISVTIEKGSKKRASFNRMKISYVSPPHDYQVVEGDPWEDYDAQFEAGEILETDFARPWVQSHNQLRRLAKIFCAKGNPDWRITGMVTDRSGLPALFEDTIRLVLTRYGIDAVFTVDRAVASADGATCTFDLTSLDPTCYDFNPATEEGIAPPLPNESTGSEPLATPSGLIAYLERRPVGGNVNAVFLVMTASPPGRLDLSLIGRYRVVGSTAWKDMRPDSEDRSRVVSEVLTDGAEYEPQGALAGYDRAAQSEWLGTNPTTIVATSDSTAPTKPTYTSVALKSGAAPAITHAFKQSPSANARSLQFLRAVGLGKVLGDAIVVGTVAESPNQSDTWDDVAPLGLSNYWLRALNASGVASAVADGAKTVINSMQAGNKTTAPYDFANAAWLKTALTPGTATTGPDGNAATPLNETTATSSHMLRQTVPITSGQRVKLAFFVKGVARDRIRLNLFDAGATAGQQAAVIFTLSAKTAAAPTYAGTNITNAVAEITQVTADWYCISLTATIASTIADGRIYILSDDGVASYQGDTAKGMILSGGTIAVVT